MNRADVKTKEQAREYAWQRALEELEALKKIARELDKSKDWEDIEEVREPLAIDWGYTLTIELSTGGDADGFILEYNKEKELINGLYYWADWGQYKEISLRMDEAELVERVYLGGCGADFLGV